MHEATREAQELVARVPFAWLCQTCRAHSDGEFETEELAETAAGDHFAECHPGRAPRYRVMHELARCQWRAHWYSRICGEPASWAHPPGARIHLCQTHRRLTIDGR